MDIELTKTFKLEQKHFKKFKEHFDYWVNEFGIKDWEVAYFFRKTEDGDGEDARASVHFDQTGRIVVCILNKEWTGSEPNDHNLARCAYHEVLELLLVKLNDMMRSKCTEDEISEQLHRVIRIFENVHFEAFWNK